MKSLRDKRVGLSKKNVFFIVAIIGISYIIGWYTMHLSLIASTCMTKAQVAADARCLYIFNNQVYQKDSRSSPHHGHPCGTDVTGLLPSSHTNALASYIIPNYVANICPATPGSPTPTHTLPPTPTSIPGAVSANMTLLLHGVGQGGDNANPNGGGNQSPAHTTRPVTITIYNSNNTLVGTQQGQVNYNAGSGNFTGSVSLGLLSSGNYTMNVATPGYLITTVPGIQRITTQTVTLPSTSLMAGDVNGDGQIDIVDYSAIIGCIGSKQNSSSCTFVSTADLNDDRKVDGIDYNLFIRELSVHRQ